MNKILITTTFLRPGRVAASRDFTLSARNGEGEVWLRGDQPADLGTLGAGTLVMASERFPRFAPLTLTLAGADLCFLARRERLIDAEVVAGRDRLLRLHCTGVWTAGCFATLERPFPTQKRVRVRRTNTFDIDAFGEPRSVALDIHVLKGELMTGPGTQIAGSGLVMHGQMYLRRAGDGELTLQLHGARLEWDFAGGVLAALRVFESRGTIANLNLVDGSRGGVSVTGALLDNLP